MLQQMTLPEINFIGGETKIIDITIFSNEQHVGVENIDGILDICDYRTCIGDPVITKSGTIRTDDNGVSYFTFELTASETKSLEGKYIYQITLSDETPFSKPWQGLMTIYSNANKEA